MNTRFSVGEIAKLNNISKQTLIYYDKEGVFKPKYTDPTNGYRYYTGDQLELLDSILILKEMGLSLKEIKLFMENRNSQNAIELMKNQQAKICNKIKHLKLISKRLERKIETIEDFNKNEMNIVFISNTKTQYLAIQSVKPPKDLLQIDISLKALLNRAEKYNYSHYYQIGAMISVENLSQERYINADYAFLPLDNKEVKEKIHEKPKGIYARCYHTGSYNEIGETYKKILNAINLNGYVPVGYSYEYCVIDSLISKKSDDYVTEIQIPVK